MKPEQTANKLSEKSIPRVPENLKDLDISRLMDIIEYNLLNTDRMDRLKKNLITRVSIILGFKKCSEK